MESKEIVEVLKKFEKDNAYKKILINGKWGIGKSYYTEQFTRERENIIYVSLFGKNDIDVIHEEISKELFKKINSKSKLWVKGKDLTKKIASNISISASICGTITINSPQIKSRSIIEEYVSILNENENLIIIIDDLERKSRKIPTEDILGIIEQLSLGERIKIVLICDESKINIEEKEIWNLFKEKVIEKEYKITKFSKEAIDSIIKQRLKEEIEDDDLQDCIDNFFMNLPIDNLRSIKKGINLFLEIMNMGIDKQESKINLVLLRVCLAVAIEKTENLFNPKTEECEENMEDFDRFLNRLDKDIETRIQQHYFPNLRVMNREIELIRYVLAIFEGDYTQELVNEMKYIIERYKKSKDEKNIFFLDEEKIKERIYKKYDLIVKNKYEYVCLNEFLEDMYIILEWSNRLNIKYNEHELKESFKFILLKNYYRTEKNIDENMINRIELRYENCKNIKIYVDEYNKEAKEKYYKEKLDTVEQSFKSKEFDVKKLKYAIDIFLQSDKKIQFEKFMKRAKCNNYFISDISGEITEEEWQWIHSIWHIFYKYMNEECKNELQSYVNSLKGKNSIQDIRIESLQNYEPLVKN